MSICLLHLVILAKFYCFQQKIFISNFFTSDWELFFRKLVKIATILDLESPFTGPLFRRKKLLLIEHVLIYLQRHTFLF